MTGKKTKMRRAVHKLRLPSTLKRYKLLPNSVRNQSKATNTDRRVRLILSMPTSTLTRANDTRLCLLNAVMNIIFDASKSKSLRCHLLSNKPTEIDMSVSDTRGILCNNGLDHKLVTPTHYKGGGLLEFFLMKEEVCRLVLTIKLHNFEDLSWVTSWHRTIT